MIHIKRAYDEPFPTDGRRYLIDRLWPRGVRKEAAALEGWTKDVAPSDDLRRWFGHDPELWPEFQRRYRAELDANPDGWRPLLDAAQEGGDITLVYGARDEAHNNAVALRNYLLEKLA